MNKQQKTSFFEITGKKPALHRQKCVECGNWFDVEGDFSPKCVNCRFLRIYNNATKKYSNVATWDKPNGRILDTTIKGKSLFDLGCCETPNLTIGVRKRVARTYCRNCKKFA